MQGVPGVGKKADAVADRSGVPLLYNHACLYRSLPHPEGKPFRFSLRGGGRLYCGQAGEYLSGTPLRSAQSLLFCRL